MYNRKKKIPVKSLFIIISTVLILYFGLKFVFYLNSDQYKLKKQGYDKNEIELILAKLNNQEVDKILTMDYSELLVKIIDQKYFIFDNLDRYLNYLEKNMKTPKDGIAIVNTNNDYEHYEKLIKIDPKKNPNQMLVNKYYYLDSTYNPTNLVPMSIQYAFEGHQISSEVYANFVEMCKEAKKNGFTLVANSSYRSFETQKSLYDYRVDLKGEAEADKFAARPGHSEHQTGLSLDIVSYGHNGIDFEETEEYKWLKDNSYRFGFILRYPENKEYLTGYSFEPWHYRYVGISVAKEVYDRDITFDEYYAYYIK